MEEAIKTPTRDALSIARDERCIPVARKALSLALEQKVTLNVAPEAVELKPITEAVLTEMTLAKMTTRDVQWVGTLMTQAVGNAIASLYSTEGVKSGDDRYFPAAYTVLKFIVDEDVPLGIMSKEELNTKGKDFGKKLQEKFVELDLNAVEVDYVMDLLVNMTANIGGNVKEAVRVAAQKSSELLFGVEYLDDVTISRIIEVHKQFAKIPMPIVI